MPLIRRRPRHRLGLFLAIALGVINVGRLLAGGEFQAGVEIRTFNSREAEGRGPTLFTTLEGSDTGIVTDNRYDDPRIWAERYNEFPVGAIGTGVAIGDYDGDGLPDLFVVAKMETCRLFHNLGNWKFEDVTAKAGLLASGTEAKEWKQGATFVDVNNDGRLDIYVCRFDAANLLYINQGDGTFKEEARERGLAVKDASGMAAFCDYDRDGWLDVYIQTNVLDAANRPAGQRDYLFHNKGDGTFTNVTREMGVEGESQGHSVTWLDYDGDGWPDIYVANDFSVPDKLYRNLKGRGFKNELNTALPCQSFHSMGSDAGDINNDGLPDLIVGEMARRGHVAQFRTIAETQSKVDEAELARKGPVQVMRNTAFINVGQGKFIEAARLLGIAQTDWTWSVRLEDLDNDGLVDLHVTTGMVREYDNVDLRARTMIVESPFERMRTVQSSPLENDRSGAFKNEGDFRFKDVGEAWGLNQSGVSFGAAFGDLDGDGDLDIIVSNYQRGLTILRNDVFGGHQLNIELRGIGSNRFGIGATIMIETSKGRQWRTLMLARGYLSSSEPMAHFGLGEETVVKRLTITWPSGIVQVLDELPADRRIIVTEPKVCAGRSPEKNSPEIDDSGVNVREKALFIPASSEAGLNLLSREQEVDESTQQPLLRRRFNRRGPAIAVGDVDGDGHDDVVLAGTSLDARRMIRGTERGFNAPEVLSSDRAEAAALNDGPILLIDINGDGADDLLVSKGGVTSPRGGPEYQPTLLLNDGRGTFKASLDNLPTFAENVGALAAADFDHTGSLDVFIGGRVMIGRYPQAPASALWRNIGGHLFDVTDQMAPGLRRVGLVTAALWTDVDNDGWIDLVVATEWGGIHCFKNHGGQNFDDISESLGLAAVGHGWWSSLTGADFNQDGKVDIVAGNAGLNTSYNASAEFPALLFFGKFAERGGPLAIEGYWEDGKLLPWQTRRQLMAKIPSVGRTFPTNDRYAAATLAEVLGGEKLGLAERYSVEELRSGVFLSQADGTYRFQAFPRLAQVAAAQGIVAQDLVGDGYADVCLVQNSSAPVYAAGSFAGGVGQLLRGDGKGNLECVSTTEAGIVVVGEARGLAVADIDHDDRPDLVVSRNNDTTLGFLNRSARQFLKVSLVGDHENHRAIGARVELDYSDGTRGCEEVYGGSGYYSQSTPALFFGFMKSRYPTRLKVFWPDGTLSETSIPVGKTHISIFKASGGTESPR